MGKESEKEWYVCVWIWFSLLYTWNQHSIINRLCCCFATKSCPIYQVPLPVSRDFSRQECWSRLPFPTPGDLLIQGSNSHLLLGRRVLYRMSHENNPSVHWWMKGWRSFTYVLHIHKFYICMYTHTHNGLLFSHKKWGSPTTCDSTDESWGHYAKQKNQRESLHDLAYMLNL